MATVAPTARLLRILAIFVGTILVLLLLVALLLVLFVRSELFEEQVRERVLPEVSERLGREVTVESVRGQVLPRPGVHLRGLRVAGQTATPFLVAEDVEARISIWPLLASRGRRMVLSRLHVESPTVHLVRLPSGAWDIPRTTPSARKIETALENITVSKGRFRVLDARGPRTLFEVGDLDAAASFVNSVLAFRSLEAEAYGASLDGGGTQVYAGSEPIAWDLDAAVEGLDLEALPLARSPLGGTLAFTLNLAGRDVVPARMGRTATGKGLVESQDLVWRSLDLQGALARELGSLLRRAGLPAQKPAGAGETRLGDLRRSVTVEQGWVRLEEPVEIDAPMGRTRLGGRWRLGMELDLSGQTDLTPDFVSTLTRNEVRPDSAVPIRYRIRGTFARPRLEDVDASAFLPVLMEEGADRLRRELEKILPPFGTTP